MKDEKAHDDQVCFTWIDFLVRSETVRVHDCLEHVGEFVGFVVSRWRLFRFHSVQYRRHAASAALLNTQVTNEVKVQGHRIRHRLVKEMTKRL